MTFLAEIADSSESYLKAGLMALVAVVGLLWRQTEKANARQIVRADKNEAYNNLCQQQHADSRVTTARLEGDVAHLRETLRDVVSHHREIVALLREQLHLPPLPPPPQPATPTQPNP